MEVIKAIKLMNTYAACPACGSDKVGNGEGTVGIEENTFTRTCKCGFEIKLEEEYV